MYSMHAVQAMVASNFSNVFSIPASHGLLCALASHKTELNMQGKMLIYALHRPFARLHTLNK
jgi:hypothetical protein